ncbi:hypothetical protein [Xylophilus rhododendri]|uniref:hypothetical protein n=1 Tax=Xylophilus rhododendri TaxID=2697032 RepID=UPI001E3601A5|nr:hypothetical protein [Xylophilus rhododendri]
MTLATRPQAWTAAEAQADPSWILRLDAAQADDVRAALRHAAALDKPLLDMVQADFPLAPPPRPCCARPSPPPSSAGACAC